MRALLARCPLVRAPLVGTPLLARAPLVRVSLLKALLLTTFSHIFYRKPSDILQNIYTTLLIQTTHFKHSSRENSLETSFKAHILSLFSRAHSDHLAHHFLGTERGLCSPRCLFRLVNHSRKPNNSQFNPQFTVKLTNCVNKLWLIVIR